MPRCVKQLTVGVEVPAVITTTDSMFPTFSVFQRSLPMRTTLVNQTQLSGEVSKQNQFFAKNFKGNR